MIIVLETPEEVEYFWCLLNDVSWDEHQMELNKRFGDIWQEKLGTFLLFGCMGEKYENES